MVPAPVTPCRKPATVGSAILGQWSAIGHRPREEWQATSIPRRVRNGNHRPDSAAAAPRGSLPSPCSKIAPHRLPDSRRGRGPQTQAVSQYLPDRMKLAGARKVFFSRGQASGTSPTTTRRLTLGLPWHTSTSGRPGPTVYAHPAAPFIETTVVFGFPDILVDPPDSFSPCWPAGRDRSGRRARLYAAAPTSPRDVILTDPQDGHQPADQGGASAAADRYVCWMLRSGARASPASMTIIAPTLAAQAERQSQPRRRRSAGWPSALSSPPRSPRACTSTACSSSGPFPGRRNARRHQPPTGSHRV